MTIAILTTLLAPVALSSAAPADGPSITALDQLPIEEATAARCGVAFALVGRWQNESDPRGANYPDMQNGGGREFFVRAMANLMEQHNLDRQMLAGLVAREIQSFSTDEGADQVEAMMPACLLLKQSAGL